MVTSVHFDRQIANAVVVVIPFMRLCGSSRGSTHIFVGRNAAVVLRKVAEGLRFDIAVNIRLLHGLRGIFAVPRGSCTVIKFQ